jgi:hypothetical protein
MFRRRRLTAEDRMYIREQGDTGLGPYTFTKEEMDEITDEYRERAWLRVWLNNEAEIKTSQEVAIELGQYQATIVSRMAANPDLRRTHAYLLKVLDNTMEDWPYNDRNSSYGICYTLKAS